MKRIVSYPAIFHYEDGGYWVEMPDVSGFVTQGDTLDEAFIMAREALGLCLEDLEDYPEASEMLSVEKLRLLPEDIISIVTVDMVEYKNASSKSVKKTLTIPAWIDSLAIKNNINFSATLKEALLEKLKL